MRILRRMAITAAALVVTALCGTGTVLASTSALWATQAGGAATDLGNAISTLADGSSIVTGYFQGTATFGSHTLTSTGNDDAFVAKIDASGSYEWAAAAGGDTGNDRGYAVSTLADGSSIVAGSFTGTATFGSTTLTSAGGNDLFVAKVDAAGSYVWATRAGGNSSEQGQAISTLADGSSIVTGSFNSGSASFGSTILPSGGGNDIFVAKIDPSGGFVWATRAGGSGIGEVGRGISTLSDGSSVVTGQFDGTATFGSISLTGAADAFVAKVDSSGAFMWATKAGGSSGDVGNAISTLADGSSIVTGYFQGTATFGSTTLTSAGSYDVFVARVNASGGHEWAIKAGGTSAELSTGVGTLADGSAIITGYFSGTSTFGSTALTSAGGNDLFVAQVDPSGAFAWATRAGGASGAISLGIGTLSDNSAIITGYFGGTSTFGSTALTSAGGNDLLVAKFGPTAAPGPPTSASATAGDAQATLSWSAPASDGGSAITSYTVTASPGGATCTTSSTSCTITGLANGTSYTFTVKATNSVGTSAASSASAAVNPSSPSAPGDGSDGSGDAPGGTTPASPSATPAPEAAQAGAAIDGSGRMDLSVRLLPSHRRLTAGQELRLGVRIRARRSASARVSTVASVRDTRSVRACMQLPVHLVIIRLPAGSLRSGSLICLRFAQIPRGQQRTKVITVRAATTRSIATGIMAWTRSTGVPRADSVTTKVLVHLRPRVARAAVTG